MPRVQATQEEPTGLVYVPELVAPDEERELIALMEGLDFSELTMHGQVAKRTVRHYGYRYDYSARTAVPGDPLPAELVPVRARCAELAALEPADFEQALVTRYPAGAGIGWHRDAPMFGSKIAGVSLGSSCRMRFQRHGEGARFAHALELEPRSAYVMGGPARWAWQHSIPATRALRYSITFRTIRR